MRPIDPAERIRLIEAAIILQRLRGAMGLLSETDEEYMKQKHALAAVIKKLQSVSNVEAHASLTPSDSSSLDEKRGSPSRADAEVPVGRR